MFKDNLLFIREAFAEFEHTGAIFPTSRWAAQALSKPLENRTAPMKILELGPGQGSVTVKILERMMDGDELLICEINPRLMRVLKTRLRKMPVYRKRESQIRFFCGPAQDLPTETKFNVIVCALPFLNFDLKTVEDIFSKIKKICAQRSVMTYYEFIGIRPLSIVFSPPQRRRRMQALDSFFEKFSKQHDIDTRPVWLNVLPIHVYNVQLAA